MAVADLNPLITILTRMDSSDGRPARFSYTQTAYDDDEIEGVDTFSTSQDQNIPKQGDTDYSDTVLSRGVRSQAASIPRNSFNHFIGRFSYNLGKLNQKMLAFLGVEKAMWADNGFKYDANQTYAPNNVCFVLSTVTIGGVTLNVAQFYIRTSVTPATISGVSPTAPGQTDWALVDFRTNVYPQLPILSYGYRKRYNVVDLTGGGFLTTTWYPVVTDSLPAQIPANGEDPQAIDTKFEAFVSGAVTGQANPCRAEMSFWARLTGIAASSGTVILNQSFVDKTSGADLGIGNSPIGFSLLPKGQQVVMWLRGGSKYMLWNEFGLNYSVKTASYSNPAGDAAVAPTVGRVFSTNKMKMYGNLQSDDPVMSQDVMTLAYFLAHTSDAAFANAPKGTIILFDANNPGPIVTAATGFTTGKQYTIRTVGTTNFTLIGAASNTVGVTFTATGPGTGTGDAYDIIYASVAWMDNVTLAGWYACTPSNAVFGAPDLTNRFVMGKGVTGAGATGGTNSYQIASANLPPHTHAIDHDHPSVTSGTMSADHSHSIGVQQAGWGAGGSGPVLWRTDSGSVPSTGGVSANHTHTVDLPNFTGSSGNGGFTNTAVDNRPAFYSAVYIRKCA